jgi:diguanylate cyclase (GGDEF)-like protein/PAS domain S-box-containing protein
MNIQHGSGSFLVGLSILIAILASYTALNLSGRITAAEPSARRWWIMAAAIALGGGTWTMHFVGMLAMSMPARYDVVVTLISLLVPIIASVIGFRTLSLYQSRKALACSGLLVGCGVVVMHYTGMAAMEMPGGSVSYDPSLVGASIVIAIAAATIALWMAFRVSGTATRLFGAVVMGGAISGMHYTAMAAATLHMDHRNFQATATTFPKAILALAVIGAATYLLLLALVTAFFDRKLAALTTREAEALNQSEQRHRLLTENSSDVIAIFDSGGRFVYESSSALQHLGYSSDELIGRNLMDFVPGDSVADARRFIATVLKQPGRAKTLEMRLAHKSGDLRVFEVVATNLLDTPPIAGIAVNLRDVTERANLRAQLEKQSETDPLTDVLNRRGFVRLAELDFERSRKAGEKLAVVMMDIDYFKQVNDRYGHAAGDLVLATVAKACSGQVRSGDLFGRIGGEEFAFLLPRSTMAGAQEMVDRLRVSVAACEVSTIRGGLSVTASFGLAYIDPAVTEFPDTLRRADEALYEAKQAGRDCVKVSASSTG